MIVVGGGKIPRHQCQHKTGEMGGGREEAWPGAGIYKKEVTKTGEEAGSGKEKGVGI
mgnify:FL=1